MLTIIQQRKFDTNAQFLKKKKKFSIWETQSSEAQ